MLTIVEARDRLRRGEISASALTSSVLERIRETDAALRAFVTVLEHEAVEAAERADDELRSGVDRGPLHGIPVALKDLFDVAGVATRAGSRVRAAAAAARSDSAPAALLRAAGAIVVGKTVTHEFAFGVTSPPARCAWSVDCSPGGSSGGSGAAVAADACLAALGTDTGCSVRCPASLNGVVGLKPTYGRVSKRGVVPLSWTCDHVGPLTKTVEDSAIVLGALAGADPADPTSADEPVPDYTRRLHEGLAGLRVGVPRNYFFDQIRADVEGAVREAIAELERGGATLVEVDVEHVELSLPVILVLSMAEGAAIHGRSLRKHPDLYGDDLRFLLETGSLLLGTQYLDAHRARSLIKRGFRTAFDHARLDVLVTPTLPLGAIPFGENLASVGDEPPQPVINHYGRYDCPFNLSGMPALTVPCGLDEQGVPVGLQIAGRPFDEETVLRVGSAYQVATRWHLEHPPI